MHCYLLAATSLDGFIARSENDRSFDWTSPEDKQFYVQKIKEADVILMGTKTFQTFERHPKGSRWVLYSRTPEKFVNPKPEVIQAEATNEDPQALFARLEKEGVQSVALCGGASIYSLFVKAGLVDTFYITVEPVVFGSGGVPLFDSQVQAKLTLTNVTRLGESTLVLEYQRGI